QVIVTSGFFVVTNTNDSGPGSLRQAMLDSEAAAGGMNTIDFGIPGAGVQSIYPTSALPPLVNPVLIDGTSQPGYAGSPVIEVNGSQDGDGGDGFDLEGSGITVRGLDIDGFAD